MEVTIGIHYLDNYDMEWEELKFAYIGDSGFDLRAAISTPVLIEPGQSWFFKTGVIFDIPKGYEIMIRSRSGLSNKKGIMMLNGVGTIDSTYRGEVGIGLINMSMSKEEYTIKPGERIAQCVVQKLVEVNLVKLDLIEKDTHRGENGFGSSGEV